MQVVHWGRARQFFHIHKDSEDSLEHWKAAVSAAHWRNFRELKNTFASANLIEDKIVFEIDSGNYLIAIAHFENEHIYIFRVLQQKQFMDGNWQE